MFGFIIGLTKARLSREAHAQALEREKREREAIERNRKEAAATVRRYGLIGRKRF